MDGPGLPTSGRPHFSSRQTRILQLGRFVGRCAGAAVGIGAKRLDKKESARHRSDAPDPKRLPRCYFLVGAGDGGGGILGEPCGTGVGGGFTSCNSTSKISVEFAPMSGPIARSPYARVEGMNNWYFAPCFIS